jgi:hypothetical protein
MVDSRSQARWGEEAVTTTPSFVGEPNAWGWFEWIDPDAEGSAKYLIGEALSLFTEVGNGNNQYKKDNAKKVDYDAEYRKAFPVSAKMLKNAEQRGQLYTVKEWVERLEFTTDKYTMPASVFIHPNGMVTGHGTDHGEALDIHGGVPYSSKHFSDNLAKHSIVRTTVDGVNPDYQQKFTGAQVRAMRELEARLKQPLRWEISEKEISAVDSPHGRGVTKMLAKFGIKTESLLTEHPGHPDQSVHNPHGGKTDPNAGPAEGHTRLYRREKPGYTSIPKETIPGKGIAVGRHFAKNLSDINAEFGSDTYFVDVPTDQLASMRNNLPAYEAYILPHELAAQKQPHVEAPRDFDPNTHPAWKSLADATNGGDPWDDPFWQGMAKLDQKHWADPEDENSGIFGYINEFRDGSFTLNSSLRTGKPDAGEKLQMKAMDAAIDYMPPIPHNTTMYRWVKETSFIPEPGQKFIDKGYVSTSHDQKDAQAYGDYMTRGPNTPGEHPSAGSYHGAKAPAMVHIQIPQGTKALWTKPFHSQFNAEVGNEIDEFVLPRGQTFEVVSKTPTKVVIRLLSKLTESIATKRKRLK